MYKKEKRIFIVTSSIFGLSYIFRFILDFVPAHVHTTMDGNDFWYNFWLDIVAYAEGLAFIALLIQHHLNFSEKKDAVS